jgi:hypothetical protein
MAPEPQAPELKVSSLAIAQSLRAQGFSPVRVEPRGKRPTEPAWQTLVYSDNDLPTVFTGNENVGILLGVHSDGTVDLDVDHGRGGALLDAIGCPKTLAYHHAKRPHLLFRCEPPPPTTKFEGSRSGKKITFIEVRSTGAQSVAPGSIHPDDGKPYEWLNHEDRATWHGEEVVNFARELATACLLSDHWHAPGRGESGARHQLALAVAGFLGRRTDRETVERIIGAVCSVMGDLEKHDRIRAVRDTVAKIDQGFAVVGLPTLAEYISDDDARTLAKWWPHEAASTAPSINFGLVSPNGVATAPLPPQEALPPPRLQILTADELLLGEPTPVPWLIHAPEDEHGTVPGGLLAEGDIGIIGAASGTGKTWLAAELSYSLVTASPLFDSFTIIRPCRVMVIDEESSTWLLRRRWLKLLKGHDIAPETFVQHHWPNLKIGVDNGFSFDNDRSLEALYIEAFTFRPDIILFDTLARVHRRPENDNSEIAKLFEDKIKPFKREIGCSIFFLHHLRKASKDAPNDPASMLRGAGDLKGQLDQFWFLRGQSGESRAIFEHDKCRAMPEVPSFVIERIDTENGGVRVLRSGALGAVGATAAEQHQDVILTYLIDVKRATRQQIVEFARGRGIGHTNVGIALKALIVGEHIDRARVGHEVEFFPVEVL